MSEKLKLFKTEVFFERPYPVKNIQVNQMEVYLPVDAISYVTLKEMGNPRAGYSVHFKKNYLGGDYPIKTINPAYLPADQIELIK